MTTETTATATPGVRDRILAAATELFYVEGINATGVDLVASKAGVSKRTLYKYFPSKVNLVEQYLARIVEMVVAPRDAPADTPRERLMSLFAVPEPDGGLMRGCPFHNAAVEAAAVMPEVAEFVHRQKEAFAESIVDVCRDLGADDPDLLGRRIALIYEGAAALSTSLNAVEPWVRARSTVELLLDQE
ncbi:TetR/AcrR family transcriptional regulator [Williamsia sp. M5A3_1d]